MSGIFSFAIRDAIEEAALFAATAEAFEIDHGLLAPLLEDAPAAAARVEINRHAAGLKTNLVVYTASGRSERELARHLAKSLHQDVVVPLPAGWSSDPYWWLMVKPTGEWFLVEEEPGRGLDLVVNESTAKVLKIDSRGEPINPFA